MSPLVTLRLVMAMDLSYLVKSFFLYSILNINPGTYTYTDGDDLNDRPIYRQEGGNAYFAVKTVEEGWKPNWVGSNTDAGTQPGDGSGLIFERDYLNPKCPHAVSNWEIFFNGETNYEPTLKVECAVGREIDKG